LFFSLPNQTFIMQITKPNGAVVHIDSTDLPVFSDPGDLEPESSSLRIQESPAANRRFRRRLSPDELREPARERQQIPTLMVATFQVNQSVSGADNKFLQNIPAASPHIASCAPSAVIQQNSMAQRLLKSDHINVEGDKEQHLGPPSISAAPATSTMGGEASRIQTLRSSAGGLGSEPEVHPPFGLGDSMKNARIVIVAVLIVFFFFLSFSYAEHQLNDSAVELRINSALPNNEEATTIINAPPSAANAD
jgi:hypothetical protein